MSEYPLTSIRLWPSHVSDCDFFRKLLELTTECPPAFDDVWLCTLTGLPSLQRHAEAAELAGQAAEKLRERKIRVSLQVGESLGHVGFGGDGYEAFNWEPMVGDDGSICRNISCPRSPGFLEYEQRMVALYAEAIRPDTVWIDDDLRMTNHGGIARGCFCPRCLEVFSAEQNRSWSRETLVAELTQNAASPVRFDWIAFNQSTLALFAGKLAEAAAAVHPGTRFALQCYHHALMYNGMNFTGVLQAMAEATGRKAGIRPGAGSYTDYDPRGQVVKAFWLGGMAKNSLNSGFADVACAENENYPHTITGKTAYGTAMEGALELAWGCNALSFVLNGYQTTSKEADACYWNEIAAWRPFYRALTGQGKPVVSSGFNFVRSMRHVSSISAGGWNWTGLNGDGDINTLLFTGIPVSWDDSETGQIPSVLTEDVA